MSSTVDTPAADAAVPGEPVRRSSILKRISDLFFSPATLFEELRDDPGSSSWVAPVAIAVGVAILVEVLRFVMVSDLQLAEFSLEQASRMGRPTPMSAEEMAPQIMITRVIILFSSLFWAVIRPFLVGLVLFVVFGVMSGGGAGYLKHVSVAAWAALVSVLALLVLSILQFASGQLDLALNAGVLAPDVERGPVAGLLAAISPFMIWLVVLLALGSAIVNRRRSWTGAAVLLMALVLVMSAAFGMLGSAFAGGS